MGAVDAQAWRRSVTEAAGENDVIRFRTKTGGVTMLVKKIEAILEDENGCIIDTSGGRYYSTSPYQEAVDATWPKVKS